MAGHLEPPESKITLVPDSQVKRTPLRYTLENLNGVFNASGFARLSEFKGFKGFEY